MAYVICEPCIATKDTACVDVCPVDCIHPRKDESAFATAEMLYIHPDECIDCGACVPACPVEAIYTLDETPQQWAAFIEKNREYYGWRPGFQPLLRYAWDSLITGLKTTSSRRASTACSTGRASRPSGRWDSALRAARSK